MGDGLAYEPAGGIVGRIKIRKRGEIFPSSRWRNNDIQSVFPPQKEQKTKIQRNVERVAMQRGGKDIISE